MSPLLAALKMLRPLNLLLGALAVLISAALMPAWPAWGAIGPAMVVVAAFNAGANALNDWFDYTVDKVNRPHRPLVSGSLPRWAGLGLAVVLFAIGTLTAAQLPLAARNIALYLALPALVLYTPLFKGLPLLGNFMVAGILGLTFLFAGAAFGNLAALWIPAGLAAGFNVLRELVKDIQDVTGDGREGVGTFPVRFGVPAAIKVAQAETLLLMFACLLPYISGAYGATYLITLIVGVELPLTYCLHYLVKHPDPAGGGWVAKVLKVDIFAGLLAVYLSKFDV